MTITLPLWVALTLLAVAAVPGLLLGAVAVERWLHWRREYNEMRAYHLKVMAETQKPFIRPAPLPDMSPVLAEIDAIRRELGEDENNVIEVDFRKDRSC